MAEFSRILPQQNISIRPARSVGFDSRCVTVPLSAENGSQRVLRGDRSVGAHRIAGDARVGTESAGLSCTSVFRRGLFGKSERNPR